MAAGFLQSTSYLWKRASIVLGPNDLASWASTPPVLIALSGKRVVAVIISFKVAPGSGATPTNAACAVIGGAGAVVADGVYILCSSSTGAAIARAAPVDCSLNGTLTLINQTVGNQIFEMNVDYVEEPPTPT